MALLLQITVCKGKVRLDILLIDQDAKRQDRICRELSAKGHNIYLAVDRIYAVHMLRNGCSPQVVLFDGKAGGLSMEMFLEALIQFAPKAKIYSMPSYCTSETKKRPQSNATPEEIAYSLDGAIDAIAYSLDVAIDDENFPMNSLQENSGELRDMVRDRKAKRAARRKARTTKL
jgi:hypothetical protein